MTDFADIWSYLAQGPLLWLTATLIAYLFGAWLQKLSGTKPWVNPVLIAVALLAGVLVLTGTTYEIYFEGAQFVHFMLGPATVALAIPLYDNRELIRASALPMLVALVTGSLVAILSALAIARALGVSGDVLISLAPKSATAPVALGVAEAIGGSPTLTAVLVILTGITGAVIASPILNLLRIRDDRARGFALGTASHGIGTARAFQESQTSGAFSGVAMGLNAILTALIAPVIIRLFI